MPRKTDTRERLLATAISVIENEGEPALNMNEVAAAIGVTKPTIYHHFGSREGLLCAALAEMYFRVLAVGSEYLLEVAPRAKTQAEFEATFRSAISMLTGPEAARRRAMRVNILGAAVTRPDLRQALVQAHRRNADNLVQFIELGRRMGFVRLPFDDEVMSLFTMAAITGRYYVEIDEHIDPTKWDVILYEVIRHLLFDDITLAAAPDA